MISCAIAALLTGAGLTGAGAGAAYADDDKPSDKIDTIVVTAQRRDESIQRVPMTVQAFTGDALTKLSVLDLDDLLKLTPNAVYSAPGAGQGQIAMRGLSTGRAGEQSYATVGNFPNVAVYLDDGSIDAVSRPQPRHLSC